MSDHTPDYRAVFFDWDGTAVKSRRAPADEVAARMKKLLLKDIKLAVISGTTLENIADGSLHQYFSADERKNLFWGLGRGAYNYACLDGGDPKLLSDAVPSKELLLKIHGACYKIHEYLYQKYEFPTDIVFSRPNYCKIDLMPESSRGDCLFFQAGELEALREKMRLCHMEGGLKDLIKTARDIGCAAGVSLTVTSDAKYLEAGPTSKSDNVDTILGFFKEKYGILPGQCAFWGDEYIGLDEGIFGSDSFMITALSKEGDFFDVSDAAGLRPPGVRHLGGGTASFLRFLESLS